jgi:riboflavin synthase
MKITFIAYKDNPVNFSKELASELSKIEDIPEVAQEATEDSDFIFVFAVTEDEEIKMLETKLIDVELKTNVRMLKAIVSDEFSDLDEEEYQIEKDEAVEKYTQMIVDILFNETAFEPQDKDFST